MKTQTKIETNEVNIGSKLILKTGKEVVVKGIYNSILPTINEIYLFETDIGRILPNEVEKIYK